LTATTDPRQPAPVGEREALLEAFQATMPFPLDPFQVEAIHKLGTHHGVLVSAPTSSGKTVVADYAIFECLERGLKAIYTCLLYTSDAADE